MRTIEAKVTSQGQVTIPAEVRRRLGVQKGESVVFVLGDDGIRIEPQLYTLESIAGSLEPLHPMSDDFDVEIEEAMSDEADRRMREWFGE